MQEQEALWGRLKLTRGQEETKEIVFDTAKRAAAGAQTQKIMTALSNSNFANALKIGYLHKRAESFFTTWREEFCVLTNVGLLYYNDPNGRPHNLFPIIDSDIKAIPAEVRAHMISRCRNTADPSCSV